MLTIALALVLGINLLFYLDDLTLEALALWRREPVRPVFPMPGLRRLAVLIPYWKDSTNFLQLEHRNHSIFLGVHSDDPDSWKKAQALMAAHSQVIVLVHEARGSRNAAWLNMARQVRAGEEALNRLYGGYVLLEGSDALHPLALDLFDEELEFADLVQLPVLSSGAYSDEHAELGREFLLRDRLGLSFPTRGTGSALRPELLSAILQHAPAALGHGYSLGHHAQRLGFRTRFTKAVDGRSLQTIGVQQKAPDSLRWAIQRRAHFALESVIQGRNFGWGQSIAEAYFFWRDRRGMAFTLLGFATSILFLGLSLSGKTVDASLPLWIGYLALSNIGLAALRLSLRLRVIKAAMGWKPALTLPLRMPLSNLVLSLAHWRALAAAWKTS
jgi:hypothetical protein